MKKIVLALILLSTTLSYANSYNFREKTELKCQSTSKEASLNVIIQKENYIGWDGLAQNNTVKVFVKINGKFDGEKVKITKKINLKSAKKSRISIQREFSVKNSSGTKISQKNLSALTNDQTMPGRSVKIVIPNGVSGYSGNAIINMVISNDVGFASLNIDSEHFKTIAVQCSTIGDSADSGQKYQESFKKLD